MGFTITDKTSRMRLNRTLEDARAEHNDSLNKLSTGTVFTQDDPRPADRALSESMEFRLRSLTSAKRNINDAVSLLQTAESSLLEINNMVTRMKELNIAAASTTITDQERRFLFIEYEALHDEINRITLSTKFNGIPILNGQAEDAPETLIFRVDDPYIAREGELEGEDLNTIRFDGLASVVTTTESLGLYSAKDLLLDTTEEEGIEIEDVEEMLIPDDDEYFATVYDEAIATISTQRAVFGALQTRLDRSLSFIDVFQENIAAARSKIADTDYATEVSRLIDNKIRMQATTALLAQGHLSTNLTLNLLSSVLG